MKRAARRFLTVILICSATYAHGVERGIASYYAGKFQGRLTANGERFDTNRLTAAHKSLPFNSIVEVQSEVNGKSVLVRINDRGPFVAGRVIDLSRAAAEAIDMVGAGLAQVKVVVLVLGNGKTYHNTSPPSGNAEIQVGAFSDKDNADNMYNALNERGFPAALQKLPGGVIRVVISDVPTDDTTVILLNLERMGYPEAFVRRRY